MSEEADVPADVPTRMRGDTNPCSLWPCCSQAGLMDTAQDLQKCLASAFPPPFLLKYKLNTKPHFDVG